MSNSSNKELLVYVDDQAAGTYLVQEPMPESEPGRLSLTSAILTRSGLVPAEVDNFADGDATLLQYQRSKTLRTKIGDDLVGKWHRGTTGNWSYLVQ